MDHAGDGRDAFTDGGDFLEDGVLQRAEVFPEFVANSVLDEIAQIFDRIEFGAVERQAKQPHVGGVFYEDYPTGGWP